MIGDVLLVPPVELALYAISWFVLGFLARGAIAKRRARPQS